eukprot:GCRY01003429.1.p1 GENE.GCRY01003429.1~~GCRY01003429.1.p1  ORF type:complete len:599 (-),score=128.01 GCRY01003429.1:473-2269(-)
MKTSLIFCFFIGLISLSQSIILDFEELKFSSYETRAWRSGMFSPRDAWSHSSPGNGHSYVTFNGSVTLQNIHPANVTGEFSFALVHHSHRDLVGVTVDNELHYCCTKELVKQGLCDETDTLAIKNGTIWKPLIITKKTFGVEMSLALNFTHNIQTSGRYYLFIANCMDYTDADAEEPIVILNGQSVWMNPFGYIAGSLYPFIPFFRWLAIAYSVIIGVWTVASLIKWRELLRIQHYISVVLLLSLLEATTRYFDYSHLNDTGYRSAALVSFSIIFATVKSTVVRMLFLIVSMGYGIVRPTLGADGRRVCFVGGIYFIASLIYNITEYLEYESSEVVTFFVIITILAVAFLDGVFYWWIFYALHRTASQLKIRQQTVKLLVYRRFAAVLLGSVVASVIFSFYQIVHMSSVDEDGSWATDWIFTSYWHVLFFVLLVAVMVFCRPSKNARQYAYSEELNILDDDDEEMVLSGVSWSEVQQRQSAHLSGGEDTFMECAAPQPATDGHTRDILTMLEGGVEREDGAVGERPSPAAASTGPAVPASTRTGSKLREGDAAPSDREMMSELEMWEREQRRLNEEKNKLLASFALNDDEDDLSNKLD